MSTTSDQIAFYKQVRAKLDAAELANASIPIQTREIRCRMCGSRFEITFRGQAWTCYCDRCREDHFS